MINVIYSDHYISERYFKCDITPMRIAQCYELELYLCGSGFTCIGGAGYGHKTNRLLMAKPGQERFSTGSFECEAVHFECTDNGIGCILSGLPTLTDLSEEKARELIGIMQNIKEYSGLRLYSKLFLVLSELEHPSITERENRSPYFRNIIAAKDFIDKNFGSPVTIADISEKAFLSPNFFRIKFTEIVGMSPHEYLNDMRLSSVKKLLVTTNKSMGAIADESGFQSQSYMNYAFKKQFGTTPLCYRKKYR